MCSGGGSGVCICVYHQAFISIRRRHKGLFIQQDIIHVIITTGFNQSKSQICVALNSMVKVSEVRNISLESLCQQ